MYRVKPAVSWPGGKSRLLKHILPLIPEHTCYCEPFAGGLAVLLAKQRSGIEVINDLNGDLITFYRCVRFHQDALLTELEFVMNSRQEFYDFRDQGGTDRHPEGMPVVFPKQDLLRRGEYGFFWTKSDQRHRLQGR